MHGKLFRLKMPISLLGCAVVLLSVRAEAQKPATPKQTNPSPASQTSYSPFDAIAQKLTSQQFSPLTGCEAEKNFDVDLKEFALHAETSDAMCITGKVATADSTDVLEVGNSIILHVLIWKRTLGPNGQAQNYQYQPDQGAWGFYQVKKNKKQMALTQLLDLSGTPYFFRAKNIYVVDVNFGQVACPVSTSNANDFDCTEIKPPINVNYDIHTTARQKQNQTDLATLVSTLMKTGGATATQGAQKQAPTNPVFWGTVTKVAPSSPVPYDVSVTATYSASQDSVNQSTTNTVTLACSVVQPSSPSTTGNQPGGQNQAGNQGAPAGQGGPSDQDVSDSQGAPAANNREPQGSQNTPAPCSLSKTVTHFDPEFWDVSVGMAIPGPIEMTYKSSASTSTSSSTSSTTVTPSKVTHTDAYAFFDLYLGEFSSRTLPTNLSMFPHLNAGIPLTGQTLHRPYVGLAENLGFLTKHVKLNIPLSVFAGPVFMKQQTEAPGTTTLKWDRATKMIYGVELPISSITNYLKSSSVSKNTSSSKNSTGGSSSSQ
jgi:hypothetical protein